MPLREDLLEPVAGDNPSGVDLYYDPVFSQIKEARREDDDSLPEGDMVLALKKKADHRTVIKLAGETLAKKSKDLRLAAWFVESSIRVEGFAAVASSIELLRSLQESFWETVYPPIEDGDMEFRGSQVEGACRLIGLAIRKIPLTKSGLDFEDYLSARAVGYEKDATSDSKREARADAIRLGRLTAEDFDHAFVATPKSLYSEADSALRESLEALDRLDAYQSEVYGNLAPDVSRLKEALEEVHRTVESLLNERRKTEPDPVAKVEAPPPAPGEVLQAGDQASVSSIGAFVSTGFRRPSTTGPITDLNEAYGAVVAAAEFLFDLDPRSPVPYMICAGLRLGETRMQGPNPQPGFAVGPTSEIRHTLRSLANRGAWQELLRASLPILASECARAWLDLHRYIWRAGQETGADSISLAVVGTVKSLLMIQPELRHWTLEDDTGAANPETQQWLDSAVLC